MNDAVHVEVEVIEFGEEGFIGNHLVDFGVALREPAVELGHSHRSTLFDSRYRVEGYL